jgi:hypothetical protein
LLITQDVIRPSAFSAILTNVHTPFLPTKKLKIFKFSPFPLIEKSIVRNPCSNWCPTGTIEKFGVDNNLIISSGKNRRVYKWQNKALLLLSRNPK